LLRVRGGSNKWWVSKALETDASVFTTSEAIQEVMGPSSLVISSSVESPLYADSTCYKTLIAQVALCSDKNHEFFRDLSIGNTCDIPGYQFLAKTDCEQSGDALKLLPVVVVCTCG
jgi:hypothetical protein